MATVWTKELFDLAYNVSAEPGGHPASRAEVRLHYNRAALYPTMLARAQRFIEVLALTPADRIVVVGCGFGWTVEALQSLGMTVVGCDISAHVQSSKNATEDTEVDDAVRAAGLDPMAGDGLTVATRLKDGGPRARVAVLNEDSTSNQSRNRVKTVLGSNPTVVITEDVVISLTDTECAALQTNIARYATGVRVVHYLTELANPNPPFNFNSKTAEEWKAIFPTSTIIAVGGKDKVL